MREKPKKAFALWTIIIHDVLSQSKTIKGMFLGMFIRRAKTKSTCVLLCIFVIYRVKYLPAIFWNVIKVKDKGSLWFGHFLLLHSARLLLPPDVISVVRSRRRVNGTRKFVKLETCAFFTDNIKCLFARRLLPCNIGVQF